MVEGTMILQLLQTGGAKKRKTNDDVLVYLMTKIISPRM
jgi:hypothetical protein